MKNKQISIGDYVLAEDAEEFVHSGIDPIYRWISDGGSHHSCLMYFNRDDSCIEFFNADRFLRSQRFWPTGEKLFMNVGYE